MTSGPAGRCPHSQPPPPPFYLSLCVCFMLKLMFFCCLNSGSQAPVVGSTSVEVVIPQTFLSYVYGENNSNLVQIRRVG